MIENLKWNGNENGIAWNFGNQMYKLDTEKPPFSVVQLVDGVSLAVVFSNEEYGTNNAYIYDAKGEVKCKLAIPESIRNAICFHEIYYISGDLTAIIATNQCDFACVLNESTFQYEKVYETR